ncbi:MAG TPA: hypothetical protein DCP49_03955 [Erysipelotrichaceae bacterium]|nr:hypothetical protein [Erysipelotrichaceae bacterium]
MKMKKIIAWLAGLLTAFVLFEVLRSLVPHPWRLIVYCVLLVFLAILFIWNMKKGKSSYS